MLLLFLRCERRPRRLTCCRLELCPGAAARQQLQLSGLLGLGGAKVNGASGGAERDDCGGGGGEGRSGGDWH